MADYAFFVMGAIALFAVVFAGVACVLLTIACIVVALTTRKPSSGVIGAILAVGSLLTLGLSALPGLVFGLVGIKQKAYPRLSWMAVVLSGSVVFFCGVRTARFFYVPEGRSDQVVGLSAEALLPYQAALAVDRQAMGFPPLPTKGKVKIETVDRANWGYEYPPPVYDVMLHFYEITDRGDYPYVYRTVALKMTEEGPKWIHEQMVFHGPNRSTTVDGTFPEQITITCEKEQVAFTGTSLKGTDVSYSGNDSRLAGKTPHPDSLSIAQVAPILREWGYEYDIENAQQLPRTDSSSRADAGIGTVQE